MINRILGSLGLLLTDRGVDVIVNCQTEIPYLTLRHPRYRTLIHPESRMIWVTENDGFLELLNRSNVIVFKVELADPKVDPFGDILSFLKKFWSWDGLSASAE